MWKLLNTFVVLLLCVYQLSFGQIYVDKTASGANNGSSWADAFTDLQDALGIVQAGDQIWVAESTYRPVTCNPCNTTERLITFNVPPDVEFYGGFNGTETLLEERDWTTNLTILSGNIGVANDSTDNSFRVVTTVNSTSKTILDGFIIEDGNADGSTANNTFFSGGGIYIDANPGGTGNIQIRNCTIRNNFAGGGGGMAIDCVIGGVCEALIYNCVFEGNVASTGNVFSTGAGILMLGNSGAQIKPKIIGCTFRDNFVGNDGGGISMTPTGATSLLATVIDSCLFINNRSTDRGAGIWYRIIQGKSEVVIKNSRFISNKSGGQGGAIFARTSFDAISSDTIANCLFSQNISDGSNSINDGEGGAIFMRGSQNGTRDHQIINCVFDRNSAAQRAGAVGTTSFVSSAGTCNVNMVNCSFFGNTTQGDGGAIHAEGSQGFNTLDVVNSILWKDSAEVAENEIFNNGANIIVSFSDVFQGIPINVTDGGNNLDADPVYADPENGNLHLSNGSPAIDAGNNSAITPLADFDLDGDPRIHDAIVDIGAYEIGIIYVDKTASGANNGSSWADAFTDLQDALGIVQAGDQIWVAESTYRPVTCNPCNTTERLITFNVPPDVEFYGGFNGTETLLEERDWTTNLTILSGNIGVANDSTDNSFRVVTTVNSTSKTILDGFIIEDGNADGSTANNTFFSGGGIYIDANPGGTGNIQIRNCTIRNNFAGGGGGMAIDCVIGGVCEALIYNCVFEGNVASTGNVFSTGAGILMLGNSGAQIKPKIIGCTFRDNFVGNDGGGISMTPTGATSLLATVIDSCLFINNRSTDRGAGIWYRIIQGKSEVVIKNSRFISNKSGGQGGAIFARTSFDAISSDTIANCLFSQNISDGSNSINDGEGGAIFMRGSQNGTRDHQIINCVFDRNSAAQRAGAVGTTSFVSSAGTCNVNMVNCSFFGNTTQGDGGAIHAEGSQGFNTLDVVNSILWKDSAEVAENEIFNTGANIIVSFSDVFQGIPINVTDGGNNLDADPLFIDAANQDFNLAGCSPAVNAGLNTAIPLDRIDLDADGNTNDTIDIDFNGETRIFEEIVDLGAFEWQGASFKLDSLIFNPIQAATEGLCDGSVKVTPFNGTAPFSFLWSNGETTQEISGLCPDVYSITVSDGFGCVFLDSVSIEEIQVNDPPIFTSDSIVSVLEDSLYSYDISTSDPDTGDKVATTGTTLPTWLTLIDNGDGTAILSGTPANNEVGVHIVTLIVTDTSGLFSEQIFIVEVINTNDPPSFTSTPVLDATEDVLYTYNITATDPDDGDVLAITDGGLPEWLALTDNGDGKATLSGTPANNDVGTVDITLTVTDAAGAFDEQSFSIIIDNVNDPPLFTSTPILAGDEEVLYSYAVTAEDVDTGDNLTISQTTIPSWLTLTDNGDGTATLSGTPSNTDVGLHNVVLVVTDGSEETDEQSFAIDVGNTNQPPSFTSTPVLDATEDVLYTYNITTLDADVGDVLVITDGGLPAWLALTDNGDGTATLRGTPVNDDVGTVDIILTVTDAVGAYDEQSFAITIDNVNDPPLFASTPILTAAEEVLYSYAVTAEDVDVGDVLVISETTLPAWLSLVDNGDGTATLSGAPTNAEVGLHNVVLVVTDALGETDEQSFAIDVGNTNQPPSFTSTPVLDATEDLLHTYNITATDTDVADVLAITDEGLPTWLALTDNGDGMATLSGTPANDDVGTVDVVLTVTDAAGGTDEQTFTITITNINDPPLFTSTPILTADENVLYTYEVTAEDVDVGDVLAISQTTIPSWLTLANNGDGIATLSGTPTNAEVGLHNVALVVTDAIGETDEQTFAIDVGNTNQPPSFTSTPVLDATEDLFYTYNITTSDADVGDVLAITDGGLPAWLAFSDNGDGTATLSGTPANDDVGTVDIVLTVKDVAGAFEEQNFTIDVVGVDPINEAPQVLTFQVEGNEDESITIIKNGFATNYSDPENEPIFIFSITSLPKNGILLLNGSELKNPVEVSFAAIAELVYVPNENFNGSDQFGWNASDGNRFALNSAQLIITIDLINDPPTNILLSNQSIEEDAPAGSIVGLLSVEDVDEGDSHLFEFASNNTTDIEDLAIENDRLVTTRELNFNEKEQYDIRILVTDNEGASFEKTFTITIVEVEEVIFQTAITPNGDGFNDSWNIPQINECDACCVEIFDRWGKKVFSSIGYQEEWDGTKNESLLPPGSYYYVIDFKNGTNPKTGAISLLK